MLLRKLMHVTWHLRTIFDTTECYRDILTCVTTFLTRSLYISLRVDLNWQNESEIGSVNVWLPFSKQTEKRSIVVWTKTRRNILKKNLKDEEKNRQIFRILFGSRGILISLFWFDPTLEAPVDTWFWRADLKTAPKKSQNAIAFTWYQIELVWNRHFNRNELKTISKQSEVKTISKQSEMKTISKQSEMKTISKQSETMKWNPWWWCLFRFAFN